jgi:UDP-glucose 4-epimerase
MKIVVTGGLGHIGSFRIRQFAQKFLNDEIVIIDDLSTQRYTSLFNLPGNIQYSFVEGKIQSIDISSILKNSNLVIHLAAITDAAGTASQPELIYQNNFESTHVLAQACMKHGVSIIFPSSTSVYGSQNDFVDENCIELFPQSPYAECKIKEENILKDFFKIGLKGCICRLGTIYGTSPGMRFHTAVNKFCWQAVMGQPLTVWETAIDQKRPYLALEDAVNAIEWIIQNSLYTGKVYNIVTENQTVRDILYIIKKHVPNVTVNYVQHKIMNQLSYEVSAQRFQNTEFKFNGSLEKDIQNTINLLKNSNIQSFSL